MKLKSVSSVMLGFLLSQTVSAAKLTIDAYPQFKKYDYICINDVGCYNLEYADEKTFNVGPIDFRHLRRIAIVNFASRLVSSTPISASCKKIVTKNHQTVLLQLELGESPNHQASIIKSINCVLLDA